MGDWLEYPRYTIGDWNGNYLDDNQISWYVESSDIRDGRAPKTHYQERPTGMGAWRARSYLSGHAFTVSGYGSTPTLQTRELARDQLLGLFVNGGQQLLAYDSGAWVRTLMVELNGQPRFAVRRNRTNFNWQLPLFAADGRMLSADAKNTPAVQSSSLSTDGLDWETGGGLDWVEAGLGGNGLDWGTSGTQGILYMSNDGNVETWPTFVIVGPMIQPTLTDPATGRQLMYSGTVAAGQTLVIDTSPYTRSVKLDGVDRFGFMLSAQWMAIPPQSEGGSLTLQFGGSGTGTAQGTWQDAYV